jgi:hypothetical protein
MTYERAREGRLHEFELDEKIASPADGEREACGERVHRPDLTPGLLASGSSAGIAMLDALEDELRRGERLPRPGGPLSMPQVTTGRRSTNKAEVQKLLEDIPVGSLVRIRWVEDLDSDDLDPGIDLDGPRSDDPRGEIVMITRWLIDTAFSRPEFGTILEFECLWRGRVMRSSSFTIGQVVEVARADD